MSTSNEITIVGAGLAGSLMALILQRRGYKITMYERYNDVRAIPSAGRSINLVLTSRGLRAMKLLGDPRLIKDMYDLSVPVTGRVMHQEDGSETFQRYGKDDSEFNLSISRYQLNVYLMNRAEEAGVKLHFGHTLASCDFNSLRHSNETVLRFTLDGGVEKKILVSGPIIGADGAGSKLRYQLRDAGVLDFTEEFCVQGYKEIEFPKNPNNPGGFCLQREGLHIWPRTTHFLMALANLDGSFTGTIYVDNENDPESFKELNTPSKIKSFFQKHYSDAIPVLGGLDMIVRQMKENAVGLLGTVRCTSYNFGGHCCLLGDSAHAITPFFGQGTNASFEDCYILAELMAKHAPANNMTTVGLSHAFDLFTRERKPNADAIAEMALDNFVEMRDRVGDIQFLLNKSVENVLENHFEDRFRSRYAMVCYGGGGNITYDAALRLGEVNWGIVEELTNGKPAGWDASQVDLVKAEQLINERLVPLMAEMNIDLSQIVHSVDDLKAPEKSRM
jgi:kynurenine 3-monooxygenase